jgi:hypothetical protein
MKLGRLVIIMVILTGAVFLMQKSAAGDVVLKTMVVNPSPTKTQTATIKAYLPNEAKPEDILELGDLEVDYDIGQGLYYVYKVVELAPGESAAREIKLKDIWIISQSELESFSLRARELVESLKKSAYFQTAITLSDDITQKQSDIVRSQTSVANALPQVRIGTYRQNIKKLDAIRGNIAQLEKLFLEYKISLTSGQGGRISVERSWAVILAVIASLGILSLVFFVIWHKQAGVLRAGRPDDENPSDEI